MGWLNVLVLVLFVAALVTLVLLPFLAILIVDKVGRRQGSVTVAYLCYLCCAALAGSFATLFAMGGGEVFIVAEFWFIPFALAAVVALVITATNRSSDMLWKLGLATVLMILAQVGANLFLPGGIAGLHAALLLALCFIYPVFIAGMAVYRRAEWWIWSSELAEWAAEATARKSTDKLA